MQISRELWYSYQYEPNLGKSMSRRTIKNEPNLGKSMFRRSIKNNRVRKIVLQDRSGNCIPGTTIDQDVCHPTEFDYYQFGHAGIQVFRMV